MTDNDHNAFLSMHNDTDCENPFEENFSWDPDGWEDWNDWQEETNSRYWWV